MAIRVLVVEPDEQLLESYQTYFDRATDFELRFASNGDDCVKWLQEFSPDVLVMEPALPCGNSQQILDAINDARDVCFVPVLVLTRFSRNTAANEHPCVRECLVKPQSLADIANTIRRIVAQSVN